MTAPDTAALALLGEIEKRDTGVGHYLRWARFCPVCGCSNPGIHAFDCILFDAMKLATAQSAEPAAKPDGMTVDDAMVIRALNTFLNRVFRQDLGEPLYSNAMRAALLEALHPAPRTGGPTS